MLEQQHFEDLERENGSFLDPNAWHSDEKHSSSSSPNGHGNNGNVDRVLYKNLVEMVPLVESLMDRRAKTSFTRRASLIYTPTPSRESYPKKIVDPKGRKTAQTIPSKKPRDHVENDPSKNIIRDNRDSWADDYSIFSSRAMAAEKDRDDLVVLQEQVEDLQKKLTEKEENLKSIENSMNQMNSLHVEFNELKRQVAEKDSLIRSAHLQLSDAKIKLADKQAALEKLQWEAMQSNRKAEKLQEDLDSLQGEVSTFMQVFDELARTDLAVYTEEDNTHPYHLDELPYMEAVDEIEMQKMEEARKAYVSAVAAAKENPSEESLAMAAEARFRLQAFVLGPNKL
ncbi:movement protein binding protein 2C isoform X2 [Tasmannia lanceolata]|uniref:movement protein binding protein 2C isoform X2 n=1 Tax=Tasmannia lanceolata TaxID=3420 RepID=UPI004064641C